MDCNTTHLAVVAVASMLLYCLLTNFLQDADGSQGKDDKDEGEEGRMKMLLIWRKTLMVKLRMCQGKRRKETEETEDSEGKSACMLESMLIFYPWCVFV